MSPQLPVELLSLIVNELAVSGRGPWKGLLRDLKSCCLAAKVFVPLCQPHIFNSVYLHSGRMIVQGSGVCIPDMIGLFSEILQEKPSICFYVKKLKYRAWVSGDTRRGIREILSLMPAVVELDLAVDNEPKLGLGDKCEAVRMDFCPRDWGDAITSMIASSTLKRLTIRNLVVPMEVLSQATGLEILTLRGCWLGPDRDVSSCCKVDGSLRQHYAVPAEMKTRPKVYLKELDADAESAIVSAVVPHSEDVTIQSCIDVSRVEIIRLRIEVLSDFKHAKYLFMRTQSVQHISMKIDTYADDEPQDFPLANLCESAFAALTHIDLDLSIECDCTNLQPLDPYLGLCEPTLSMLTNLERLKMNINLHTVHHGALSLISLPRWRKLDEILAPVIPGLTTHYLSLDKLKEVAIDVRIHETPGCVEEECSGEAPKLAALIRGSIRPKAYAGLIALAQQGQLQFSFIAELGDKD